ncbi:hypothetical protein AVEN_40318-1 [Araneus ventricosus]|uniref:Uncharacterized protein n=1 Tax=Araneus ventricosus TaxID=182803 RepID=A0A4Y2UZL5_ARAVE|nr:hypothetical protein AVEN_40318-1 [Araneus ventricosus]
MPLEYDMSEDLEDSPAVNGPPPSSKPQKETNTKQEDMSVIQCQVKRLLTTFKIGQSKTVLPFTTTKTAGEYISSEPTHSGIKCVSDNAKVLLSMTSGTRTALPDGDDSNLEPENIKRKISFTIEPANYDDPVVLPNKTVLAAVSVRSVSSNCM